MLTITEIAGFAGGGLAGAAYVPQISHLIKARCSAGISRLAGQPGLRSASPTPGHNPVPGTNPAPARSTPHPRRQVAQPTLHRPGLLQDVIDQLKRQVRG